MDEQEISKNPQAENLVKARLKGIQEIVDSSKPSAVWVSESDWSQGGFNRAYLQKLGGIVTVPEKTEQMSDPLARGIVPKEIFERLEAKEWKLNAYFSGWDTNDRHIYAKTNIPGVYAHQMLWHGSGWGGSLVFVSANLEEEKINSISNITELKKAWEEKYKRIESASRESNPQSVLIEDIENIRLSETSEDMLRGVFRNIPMWDSADVSLSETNNEVDSPPIANTINLLLQYGLNPQSQGSIIKNAETSTDELRWFYYKTKFPNVFLHRVYSGFKKDNTSILLPSVMRSQTFVTINCPEEQFKLE